MTTTMKHIKKLQDSNVTLLQLLNSYIFGDKEIKIYNPIKTYNTGDLILFFDGEQKISVLQCLIDNVTGVFNPNNWSRNIVNNFISGISNNEYISLSSEQPIERSNKIWLQILRVKESMDPDNLIANNAFLIFDAKQITGQDNQPEDDTKLWFDYEPYDN
jgi:hypothetical protein